MGIELIILFTYPLLLSLIALFISIAKRVKVKRSKKSTSLGN